MCGSPFRPFSWGVWTFQTPTVNSAVAVLTVSILAPALASFAINLCCGHSLCRVFLASNFHSLFSEKPRLLPTSSIPPGVGILQANSFGGAFCGGGAFGCSSDGGHHQIKGDIMLISHNPDIHGHQWFFNSNEN